MPHRLQPVVSVVNPNDRMPLGLRSCCPPEELHLKVDVDRAHEEYEALVAALTRAGVRVLELAKVDEEFDRHTQELADRVFPEDWGIRIGKNLWIGARMTPEERGTEPVLGTEALIRNGVLAREACRSVEDIDPEARLEAGDLLRFFAEDGTMLLFAALSSRTNERGISALERIVRESGERCEVHVTRVLQPDRCLHGTSGAGILGERKILIDPGFVDAEPFARAGVEVIEVHPAERGRMNNANCVWIRTAKTVFMDEDFPLTMRRVEHAHVRVQGLPNRQHRIIQGGLSCRMSTHHNYVHPLPVLQQS